MMSSRYLATFQEEIFFWSKHLGQVADVITLLGEVLRTWAYLETLFVGSDEVKMELPDTTDKFREVDVHIRAVLNEAAVTPNVMQLCCKEGLLHACTPDGLLHVRCRHKARRRRCNACVLGPLGCYFACRSGCTTAAVGVHTHGALCK